MNLWWTHHWTGRGKRWNFRNLGLVGGSGSLSFSVSLSLRVSLSLCVVLTLAFLPVHYKANIISPLHPPPVIVLPRDRPQAQSDQPHVGWDSRQLHWSTSFLPVLGSLGCCVSMTDPLEQHQQKLAFSGKADGIWLVCRCSQNSSCSVILHGFCFVSHPSPPDQRFPASLDPTRHSPSVWNSWETPSQVETDPQRLDPWTPADECDGLCWKHYHEDSFAQIMTCIWYCPFSWVYLSSLQNDSLYTPSLTSNVQHSSLSVLI